ncbi:Uncharacterised protein [Paenibacillus thiaminolyticus]|nr:Uncharacterised protein [Paenibacillus thiaminolyticus]
MKKNGSLTAEREEEGENSCDVLLWGRQESSMYRAQSTP